MKCFACTLGFPKDDFLDFVTIYRNQLTYTALYFHVECFEAVAGKEYINELSAPLSYNELLKDLLETPIDEDNVEWVHE